ncbi:hypothetical protein SAMN02745823_03890 [Sporobacter termitidis DSM 10068]|uniref:Phage tail tube protein, GTA-gp10 n=1 Tax=Sporobacter termitidis DSM 10068 TaxID=1123282 RepID=A0A1M5ZKY2_9FIRM|nr:DUF6096 family protein [Sporobacter termitidis]SHI25005.1 hypothetical protein SAMN02745823_03890 [Sporobacter termitidis DSM 10068]
MYYTTWRVDGEEYKLRLNTMAAVQIEKQLEMGMSEIVTHITDTTVIVTLLWGAMQHFHHGTNMKDVCGIYDRYLDGGGDIEQMTDVLVDLLAQVGFGSKSKNAVGQKAGGQAAETFPGGLTTI